MRSTCGSEGVLLAVCCVIVVSLLPARVCMFQPISQLLGTHTCTVLSLVLLIVIPPFLPLHPMFPPLFSLYAPPLFSFSSSLPSPLLSFFFFPSSFLPLPPLFFPFLHPSLFPFFPLSISSPFFLPLPPLFLLPPSLPQKQYIRALYEHPILPIL